MPKIGVLLTNTGTPDAPTTRAVRRYLREFLSDRRVVQLPRLIWLPLLYGLILPFRAPKSARLYQSIWTPAGSPMRVIMNQVANSLQAQLRDGVVAVGMNYGNPSIAAALKTLQAQRVDQIIVLPLFPQYSHTSTGSSFDRVDAAARKLNVPITKINDYATNPDYIQALTTSIQQYWQTNGRAQRLLISFHGIPERFAKAGDPYADQCRQTADLLARALNLTANEWTLCFQSQFGYDKWLQPSTQDLLNTLPTQGITNIDIICPGFAVDCLETLEEINIRAREIFLTAGGHTLRYIPALNDTTLQIDLLAKIITSI